MRPNAGNAAAELRPEARLFEVISIKFKRLQLMLVRVSVLRKRCGEPAAKSRHHIRALGAHAAAFRFLRGGTMAGHVRLRYRAPPNCGKYSAEKPRAGNGCFGMRIIETMCPK